MKCSPDSPGCFQRTLPPPEGVSMVNKVFFVLKASHADRKKFHSFE